MQSFASVASRARVVAAHRALQPRHCASSAQRNVPRSLHTQPKSAKHIVNRRLVSRGANSLGTVAADTMSKSVSSVGVSISDIATSSRKFSTGLGEKLFDKILIANRGEITCRIIRTARRLGIKTVAIYSEPDAHALHVQLADEAYCVGPAASTQSYLNIPAIMDVIKKTGAQAVHPGYGFLSENHNFAEALEQAGVAFMGPPATAITSMGDKIESKTIARDAGVNTIPGFLGTVNDNEDVKKIANEIGYPVMIKASAGGGGKGMRVAWNDEEAIMGFRLSKQEAASSFGDDRIFIEKYIEEPRHIEIQLVADKHGNIVAFPERECSIQRRNQKVIEEAPSVLLDPETRKAMGEQACALARAVGYVSAGTVEFLCDKHKNFYFLEMNTRLQVEHPITEYISGVDLVHQMIRVAAGHELPKELVDAYNSPTGLPIKGWAIESRVYAEEPMRGFLPSTGVLNRYVEPSIEHVVDKEAENTTEKDFEDPSGHGVAGVRVDAGVAEGAEISMFYDPMICKLVTHGPDRATALKKMRDALDAYTIRGVGNNIEFLRDIIDKPRFVDGKITTNFIPEEYPEGFVGRQLSDKNRSILSAVAGLMHIIRESRNHAVSGQKTGLRSLMSGESSIYGYDAEYGTFGTHPVAVQLSDEPMTKSEKEAAANEKADESNKRTFFAVSVDWSASSSDALVSVVPPAESEEVAQQNAKFYIVRNIQWQIEDPLLHAEISEYINPSDDSEPAEEVSTEKLLVQYYGKKPEGFTLGLGGAIRDVSVRSPRQQELTSYMLPKPEIDFSKLIVSPMPGSLISVAVKEGDHVEPGQEVAVVEAMKMQNVLRAAQGGRVKSIKAQPGATLTVDQVIVEFETE